MCQKKRTSGPKTADFRGEKLDQSTYGNPNRNVMYYRTEKNNLVQEKKLGKQREAVYITVFEIRCILTQSKNTIR